MPSPGLYRHYKGGNYMVIGIARLIDSNDLFVIYHPVDRNYELYARPLSEFEKDVNGVPRFTKTET